MKTHLSRPTVSHHLKILKESQIISVRKEGTLNYYSLDSGSKLKLLKNLVNEIEKLLTQCEEQASEQQLEKRGGGVANESDSRSGKRSGHSSTRVRPI